MAEATDPSPPPFISMSSTMSAESGGLAGVEAEIDPLHTAAASKSPSLLRLPPELALYVSRTDDTLLRLNKYAHIPTHHNLNHSLIAMKLTTPC